MAAKSQKSGAKHRLIVYRFMSWRYRPAALLFILIGILALLPNAVSQLQFSAIRLGIITIPLNYLQVSAIGVASISIGLCLLLVSSLMVRQAFVQCRPEYLLISTLSHRVFVAYTRINSIQPVQVGRIFDTRADKKTAGKNALSDREKKLVKAVLGDPALEAEVSAYPLPEKTLRKRFSRFLFSTREQGFIFIVPKPQALSIELSSYMQRARDRSDEDQQRYLDPIERLKYQNNKTF